MLTLDTATEEGASALYERLGFTFAGEIPDYALKPHGGLTGTRLYWKRIGGAAVVDADAGRIGARTPRCFRIAARDGAATDRQPHLKASSKQRKGAPGPAELYEIP